MILWVAKVKRQRKREKRGKKKVRKWEGQLYANFLIASPDSLGS